MKLSRSDEDRGDETIAVSIIEDDEEVREALGLLIDGSPGFVVLESYGDCESALKQIGKDPPDVLLMDIELPGMSGIEGAERIKKIAPSTDIIMLTVHKDNDLVFQSLCAGATGYLLKTTTPARILEAVRDVRTGGAPMSSAIARKIVESFRRTSSPLTDRETDVLTLLCKGHSYKMIAGSLFISEQTVHFHIKNIYQKLQVHSKSEAVAKALKERLV
ncbi:MAG: response regulator transcription factor [Ignavibacteria bacterium]|nr:response regulator transcription factor [Ignavibacteria bacterium]